MTADQTPATPRPSRAYRVDDLRIDTRLKTVSRNGADLGITGLSFDLLIALARAAPDPVPIDVLIAEVWHGAVVSPETVTQRVKLLRQALGDDAEKPRYIAVRRGFGYRLAAEAEPLEQEAPTAAVAPQRSPEVRTATGSLSAGPVIHVLPWLLAAALALLSAATALWWAVHPGERISLLEQQRASSAMITQSSIAVMPFANLTGEPAKEYVGDGMAEELISALSAIPGLKVPARTSSFAYRDHDTDIRKIAQDLGVANILEGSVRSAGARIRISTRLVDAHSGYQIWSQSYDREFSDLFKLQDDLAAQIVQALSNYVKTNLSAPADRTPPTRDLEAYRLYMQARAVGRGTIATAQDALRLLNQALARDPNFADALAIRAYIVGGAAALGYLFPPAALDAAEQDARRALALRPGLANAHDTLGTIHTIRGEWIDAGMSFQAALTADPVDPFIRNPYSLHFLRPLGMLRQAHAALDESYRLAPADGFTIHEQELINSLMGADAEAIKFAKLSQELGGGGQIVGNAMVLARAAARTGRYSQAAEFAAAALPSNLNSIDGTPLMSILYAALADPSRKPAARKSFAKLLPRLETDGIDGQVRGVFLQAFTLLGALDSAYALANWCVDTGVRERMFGSRLYLADFWLPEMRPFRLDPRFQSLVKRLKMIDYWRQAGPPDGCEVVSDRLICR